MESVVLIGLTLHLSSPDMLKMLKLIENEILTDAKIRQSIIDSSDWKLPLIANSADPSLILSGILKITSNSLSKSVCPSVGELQASNMTQVTYSLKPNMTTK